MSARTTSLAKQQDAGEPQKDDDKPLPVDDTRTQAKKFEDAARELGCDENEDRFKGVLRKLAQSPRVAKAHSE